MTDEQKIERLAKWMGEGAPEGCDPRIMLGTDGRYYVDVVVCAYSKDAEPEYRVKVWNPLTNIADAWMLVEKAYQLYKEHDDIRMAPHHSLSFNVFEKEIWRMIASEAASAISEAVLEVIS